MTDDDILKDAQEAFEAAQDRESENRNDALDDLKFVDLLEQWPEQIKKQRELDGRPCLTIDTLGPVVRQVLNDARQNKPSIMCHPVDDNADPDTAEILNGLIRNIEQSSDAEVAYDTALAFAVKGGFGYFTINTAYAHDDSFEQDIVIERVANPFSIYGDPDSTAADSSDWNVAFQLDAVTKEQFEAQHGDADPTSFADSGVLGEHYAQKGDRIVLTSYWTREEVKRQIVALSAPNLEPTPEVMAAAEALGVPESGIVGLDIYEQNKALFDALGVSIVGRPREVPSYKVTQRLLSGGDVLETVEWAGKYIPIVPVYGDEVNIEGKRYFRSLVRNAKDAQRMFNFWRTMTTELVALAPKAPYIGPVGSFETDAARWATANTDTHPFLEYDNKGVPPQRQPFSGVPAGALQEAMNASDDIKRITGIYDASLGARSNETSGKAIMARQREGDISTFHYIDNLSRAIRHAGRILVDIIPKVYSVPRVIRTLGPQNEPSIVKVNQQTEVEQKDPASGQVQKISKIYDLTTGKYDVTVKAGPSFTTQRQEATEYMTQAIQAAPQTAPIILPELFKKFDWPGADKIAEKLEALTGENPQVQQIKQEAQQIIQQGSQQIQQLQAQVQQLTQDQQGKAAELELKARELEIKAFDAETKRIQAMKPPEQPQADRFQ